MPRKKSASKKEKENKQKLEEQEAEADKLVPLNVGLDDDEYQGPELESSDEEEDEYGELLDQATDEGISKVLQALKSNDKSLLDSKVRFFDDPEEAVKKLKSSGPANKPMYLKDYHRIKLLEGRQDDDEDEDEERNDEPIQTYNEAQEEAKTDLLSEINRAFDDEAEDGDFLEKKTKPIREETNQLRLPNPENDQEQYLEEFVKRQAWIPKTKSDMKDLGFGQDSEDIQAEQEFDDAVENFEKVYNFRYEDASSAEIITYARNQATIRRSNMNSRKKQRLKKQDKKNQEKVEHEVRVAKKKQLKINKVMDRLEDIKKAVGDEVDNELIEKVFGDSLLNDDFNDADWDEKMGQIFNEKFYEEGKPEWDDDIEVDKPEQEVEESPVQSKKEKLAAKKSQKKSKEQLKKQAEDIVQSNLVKVEEEVEKDELENGDLGPIRFKYREVDPDSFGLTSKEILLADDKSLNEYIGLKKFAPYRSTQLINKDKRKVTKSRRLREWRKATFGDENGLVD